MKYNKETVTKVRTMSESGMSHAAIAQETGVKVGSVTYLINKRKLRRTRKDKGTPRNFSARKPDVDAVFDLISDLVFDRIEAKILKIFSKAFGEA
jgi:orotate phosphoribosyltransferase-like protein